MATYPSARGPCDASTVPLVWVTGNSGSGKSTVQALLKERGEWAVDADWDGYCHWVDRTSGRMVGDPPYPVPAGWLNRFAWRIDRRALESLRATAGDRIVFVCGSAENESDVRDLFDRILCLVVDNATLSERLKGRTTNAFGTHPEELAAALAENAGVEGIYNRLGAIIIDGSRSAGDVADQLLVSVDDLGH